MGFLDALALGAFVFGILANAVKKSCSLFSAMPMRVPKLECVNTKFMAGLHEYFTALSSTSMSGIRMAVLNTSRSNAVRNARVLGLASTRFKVSAVNPAA
jgi:hypothetical protein